MALPKIVESEPWLEEDDDFPVKTRKRSFQKELAENTAMVSKMVKSGVYLYIFINLISKSRFFSSFLVMLKSLLQANKFSSPIIISAAITIFSLLQKKYLN